MMDLIKNLILKKSMMDLIKKPDIEEVDDGSDKKT
jgi:hypothetical protein